MTPREAWAAYTDKTGITKEEAEKKHWEKTGKKEEQKGIKSREEVLNTNESLKTICDSCEKMGVKSIHPTEKQYKSDDEIIKQIAGGRFNARLLYVCGSCICRV